MINASYHDHDNGECNGNTPWRLVGSQGSTEPSKHNQRLYYPPRLLPILGYSDIPLVGVASHPNYYHPESPFIDGKFPSQPHQTQEHFVSLAAAITLPRKSGVYTYFPLHRKGNFRCLANSGLKAT